MILRLICVVSVLATMFLLSDVTDGFRMRREDTTEAPAPAGGAPKLCVKCVSIDACGNSTNTTMNCTVEPFDSKDFGAEEKKIWNATGKDAELSAMPTQTHCVTVQVPDKAEFRGCVPEKVGTDKVCDLFTKAEPKAKCELCAAKEAACNTSPALKAQGDAKKKSAGIRISYNITLFCWIVSTVLLKLIM